MQQSSPLPPTTPFPDLSSLPFDNIGASLPEIFYSRHRAEPLENQRLATWNARAAALIDLDPAAMQQDDAIDLLTGIRPWPGTDPMAMCYAGHQFGQYVPRLGDGRALSLGQVRNHAGELWDIQLKGSGLTLYSRMGDGKAVLRSTIREYLCSAAMRGLGIPTTDALAIIDSDEPVYRETRETGAMLVRLAPSFIRFGTFEYFFYQNRHEDLATLGDFLLRHYMPALLDEDEPYLALLQQVVRETADLIARWQAVGFCHGVMNSDNMSIHGLTIDYGPYGFLDRYDPDHICNHSDHGGRYAFSRQPGIGLFNLGCLAQALLPLIDEEPEAAVEKATQALNRYQGLFEAAYLARKREKLGLGQAEDEDGVLYDRLLDVMAAGGRDFTRTFRILCQGPDAEAVSGLFGSDEAGRQWLDDYRDRLAREGTANDEARTAAMKAVNPAIVLRNHLAETAIREARDNGSFAEVERLVDALADPFSDAAWESPDADPPPDWAASIAVSCSS